MYCYGIHQSPFLILEFYSKKSPRLLASECLLGGSSSRVFEKKINNRKIPGLIHGLLKIMMFSILILHPGTSVGRCSAAGRSHHLCMVRWGGLGQGPGLQLDVRHQGRIPRAGTFSLSRKILFVEIFLFGICSLGQYFVKKIILQIAG